MTTRLIYLLFQLSKYHNTVDRLIRTKNKRQFLSELRINFKIGSQWNVSGGNVGIGWTVRIISNRINRSLLYFVIINLVLCGCHEQNRSVMLYCFIHLNIN